MKLGGVQSCVLMKKCTFLVQRSILLQRTKIDFLKWTILTADVTMQSIHSQRAKVDKINFYRSISRSIKLFFSRSSHVVQEVQ